MAISRLQRWAIILASYTYTIEHRPTHKHYNADVCSRFPLKNTEKDEDFEHSLDDHGSSVCAVCTDDQGSSVLAVYEDKPLLNSTLIARYTKTGPVLSKVMMYILEG